MRVLAECEASVCADEVAKAFLHVLEAREGTALALEMVHDGGYRLELAAAGVAIGTVVEGLLVDRGSQMLIQTG